MHAGFIYSLSLLLLSWSAFAITPADISTLMSEYTKRSPDPISYFHWTNYSIEAMMEPGTQSINRTLLNRLLEKPRNAGGGLYVSDTPYGSSGYGKAAAEVILEAGVPILNIEDERTQIFIHQIAEREHKTDLEVMVEIYNHKFEDPAAAWIITYYQNSFDIDDKEIPYNWTVIKSSRMQIRNPSESPTATSLAVLLEARPVIDEDALPFYDQMIRVKEESEMRVVSKAFHSDPDVCSLLSEGVVSSSTSASPSDSSDEEREIRNMTHFTSELMRAIPAVVKKPEPLRGP